MKIIAVYDNGGKTFDRYTVVLDEKEGVAGRNGTIKYLPACFSLSPNCDSHQGVSMYGVCDIGPHLGKKIAFKELPENVQKHVERRIAG